MKKIYGSHSFYFDQKIYFVYFLVSNLEWREIKLQENSGRKKWLVVAILLVKKLSLISMSFI